MEGYYGVQEKGLITVHLGDMTFERVIFLGEVISLTRKDYSKAYVAHMKLAPRTEYVFYLPKGEKYKGKEFIKIRID
ncbi:MAG: hypothetical protein IJS47_01815 [Clostridia bacterium]|nr:hypothetical protein [Clostridia bacterium]